MSDSRELGVSGRTSMRILAVGLSLLLTFPALGHSTDQQGSYAYAGGSFYQRDESHSQVDLGRGVGLKLGFGYRFNRAFGLELMLDQTPAADPENFAYAYTDWERKNGYVLNSFDVDTTGAQYLSLAAAFEIPLNKVGKSSLLAKIGLGFVSVDWSGTFELEHPERGRVKELDDEEDATWPVLVAAAGGKFPIDATGKNEIHILATKYMDLIQNGPFSLGVSFKHNF